MRGILIPGVSGMVALVAAVLLMAVSAPGAHAHAHEQGPHGTITTASYIKR